MKFASDFYQRQFSSMSFHDKSFQYDHVGRLQKALTAVMANDVLNGTSTQFASSGPYKQTNTYDAWDNLIGREGLYWSEDNAVEPQTYDTHNRNYAWSYDADGRLLSMYEPAPSELPFVPAMHTYDAAGRHVKNTQTTSRLSPLPGNPVQTTITTIDAGYDGDGQQVKRVETKQINSQQPTSGPVYYLRSSVLRGQVVTEYDAQGGRLKSYVYGGGALIASTNSAGLVWRYNNPVTGDGRETDAQGKVVEASSLDPEGVDAGMTDPADNHGEPTPPEPLPHAGAYAAYLPHRLGGSGYCRVNGMETGCGFASSYAASGAAEPARPTVQAVYSRSLGRYVGFASWDASAAAAGVGIGTGGLHGLNNNGQNTGWVWFGQTFSTQNGVGGVSVAGNWYSLGDYGHSAEFAEPQNTPTKTAEQQRCDDKIAFIFGGEGAVAAASGFEPVGGNPKSSGTFRGTGQDISDRAIHIYGNGAKNVNTGVYLPGKITGAIYPNPQTLDEYKGGSFVAFYSNLNGLKNVSLIVTHLAGFTPNSRQRNDAGSRYVGTTGGKGGEDEDYLHAHFELVQGRVRRFRSTVAMKHYSFADVFCK